MLTYTITPRHLAKLTLRDGIGTVSLSRYLTRKMQDSLLKAR